MPAPGSPRSISPLGLLAPSLVTLGLLGGIAVGGRRESPSPSVPPPASVPESAPPVPLAPDAQDTPPRPIVTPEPPPRPVGPDPAAIARAQGRLDDATKARAEAEARLAAAEVGLRAATLRVFQDAAAARDLAYRVADPSARIERAVNASNRTRWEIKKIQAEMAAIERAPKTKAKALVDQSAVARPVDGKEYHFEIHDDRVAFIDIDRLTDLVKADAKLRVRVGARGRSISGLVGPIHDFSMRYEVGLAAPSSVSDLVDPRELSYQLIGWEMVPDGATRGETYETAWQPAAVFARAIGRLNPERATITLWIYPDGFPLYRRLRDDLHRRGFLVAARPLPDGMAIRGSPGGSISAGQ